MRTLLTAAAGLFAALCMLGTSAAQAQTMTRDNLIYYLSNPRYATASRYDAKDSANNAMQCVSIIDLVGQTDKYAAVYHTPYQVTGGWRYKINLATSNDLINWTYRRMLVDNADMPKIAKVVNGAWIVLIHEQWMNGGTSGPSASPCRIGFKLFYDSTDLWNGTVRSTWTAPSYLNNLNGTPNIYNASIGLVNNYWCVSAQIGFHYWNGTRDANCVATVTNLFHPLGGTGWYPSVATAYNNKFINAGVSGNIGQRDALSVSSGRYNIQEGNVGTPRGSWDLWRIWLYTYSETTMYPTGAGSVLQLAPQTPGGSTSFGNPAVNIVSKPSGTGQVIFVSYFLFSEGAAPGEAGSLIYYFNL